MLHKKAIGSCSKLVSSYGRVAGKIRCGFKALPKVFIVLATLFATATSAMVLLSCTGGMHSAKPKTSAAMLDDYSSFWHDLKSKKEVSGDALAKNLKEWRVLKDSVMVQLVRDTIRAPHTNYEGQFETITDSIRYEFARIVMGRKNSYKDFVMLKEAASPYMDDADIKKAVKSAEPFFSQLNKNTTTSGQTKYVIANYERFLKQTMKQGVGDREQMLAFIKDEDIHFRSFLSCFDQLHDQPIGEISKLTEEICKQIYVAANEGKLPLEDALVYMAIRNNRRLIQNAQTCLADIQSGKVRNKAQAQSYSWVLLQPYTAINEMSIAILTTDDRQALLKLAEETPKALTTLNKELAIDAGRLDRMSTLLIKAFIYTI